MSRIITIVTLLCIAAFTSQGALANEVTQATGLTPNDIAQYADATSESVSNVVAGNDAAAWGWVGALAIIVGFMVWAGSKSL